MMRPRLGRRARVRGWTLCLGWPMWVAAQTADTPYQDRVIEPARLGASETGEEVLIDRIDPEGPPRTLSAEVRAQSRSDSGGAIESARWALLRGTLDTERYGAFTLDAAARLGARAEGRAPAGERSLGFTLAQRRMPFDAGWWASQTVGLMNTGSLDVVAQQARFGLPTRQVLGAGTEWQNSSAGLAVLAASGEPVALDPIGQGGYTPLGGRDSVVGLRWRTQPGFSAAAQWADHRAAETVSAAAASTGLTATRSSRGGLLALRWDAEPQFAQVNLIRTVEDGDDSAHLGAWLDAGLSGGATEHRLGLNWLPDRQPWLGASVAAGAVGGYYRWRWRSRQLLAEAQLDHQRLGEAGSARSDVSQLWTSLRYQFDQNTAWGTQWLGARTAGAASGRVLGYRERFDEQGSWRAFAEAERNASAGTAWQVGADANLRADGWQLGGAAALALRRGLSAGSDVSATLAREFGVRWNLVAGARRFAALGGTSTASSLTANLQYRISARWLLSASANDSRGSVLPAPVGPGTGAPDVIASNLVTPRQRLYWLALRYDMSAGTPSAPLGGAAGSGGGAIEGTLFLDGNGNGLADAGEAPLANITVVLDERFAVRTNAQGRFEFPFVTAGPHTLRVVPDNIPLPWGLGDLLTRQVTVTQRGTVTLTLGATRQ